MTMMMMILSCLSNMSTFMDIYSNECHSRPFSHPLHSLSYTYKDGGYLCLAKSCAGGLSLSTSGTTWWLTAVILLRLPSHTGGRPSSWGNDWQPVMSIYGGIYANTWKPPITTTHIAFIGHFSRKPEWKHKHKKMPQKIIKVDLVNSIKHSKETYAKREERQSLV